MLQAQTLAQTTVAIMFMLETSAGNPFIWNAARMEVQACQENVAHGAPGPFRGTGAPNIALYWTSRCCETQPDKSLNFTLCKMGAFSKFHEDEMWADERGPYIAPII